jgi:hypothetical protein
VGTTVVLWLGREVKGVSRRARGLLCGSLLGAPCVFPGVVQMAIVVASELGGCFLRDLSVSPRKGGRKFFSKAVSMVEMAGEKSAAWE